MFLRLAAADVFVHGIGGGKYDQITICSSKIFGEFNRLVFWFATATIRLPFSPELESYPLVENEATVMRMLRERMYAPERLLSEVEQNHAHDLVQKKYRMIDERPASTNLRQWHADMCSVNDLIRNRLPLSEEALLSKLSDARNYSSFNPSRIDATTRLFCLMKNS